MRAAELPMSPVHRSSTRYCRPSWRSSALGAGHDDRAAPGPDRGSSRRRARPCRTRGPEAGHGCPVRRTGLPAVAGGAGGEPEGQRRPPPGLAPPHRGERDLGRRDGPQVIALQVVGVLFELRQVAGRDHRAGQHQRRRPDLLELVGMAVEGEGAEGPQQSGPEAAVEGEHRAGQLGPALHVEQSELGTDLPVGHPLGLGVDRRHVGPGAGHHVVVLGPRRPARPGPAGWAGRAAPGGPPPGRPPPRC